MQISENDSVLMTKEELFNKIVTMTGGRSAEEVVFGSITSGASNDIEQATKLARSMVTRLGMTEEFDMMATEVVANRYLGGDAALQCSETTAGKIDAKVLALIKELTKRHARFCRTTEISWMYWHSTCWRRKLLPASSLWLCCSRSRLKKMQRRKLRKK